MPEPHVVTSESLASAIEGFTALDKAGDKRSLNELVKRLGKEQPALLAFASRIRAKHGDVVGQAAIFYATLVWAMFDRQYERALPRLLEQNLEDATQIVDDERQAVEGLTDQPIHERLAPGVRERQPHVVDKLRELVDEDVREAAMTPEAAEIIYGPTQAVVEAFDAAVSGRRPGQNIKPVTREVKVGRNDPCPCGSGKKYKRCCGAAVA